MYQDTYSCTSSTENEVVVLWKIDDCINAFKNVSFIASIAGPTFVMPTQPASEWETYVDFEREKDYTLYYFRAQSLGLHFFPTLTKFDINYHLSAGNKEDRLKTVYSSTLQKNSDASIRELIIRDDLIRTRSASLLIGDRLVLKCRFEVVIPSFASSVTALRESSQNDLNCLSDNFKTLYSSQTFSDFTIVVEGKSFPVHRCVLSARSPVFAAMLKGDTVETASNTLVIEDFKFKTMEAFLLFIYTGQLGEFSVDEYRQLYSASDKYSLESLKKISAQKLVDLISVDNVCDLYTLGHYHNDVALQLAATTYVKQNASSFLISEKCMYFVSHNKEIAAQMIKEAGI